MMKKFGLISPSTRALIREARNLKGFSLLDFLHSYIYGRWIYFYIAVGTGQHRLARLLAPLGQWLIETSARLQGSKPQIENKPSASQTFANTYHGKVIPLETARQLVSVKEEISLALPESVLPYDRARDIILQNPDHIVVLDCPCRAAKDKPCLPLDVCLIVGEPFASFTLEHHPSRSRAITSAEAVAILQAEDKRGHVHHAFFKDAMLGRFYAICNCCSCCCGAMHGHRSGVPMLASSGYVAQIETERCKGCGLCVKYCQFKAITLQAGKAIINADDCMGCGVCVSHCHQKAITLVLAPERGEPLIL